MDTYILHYAEIGLKGKNMNYFIKKLVRSLETQAPMFDVEVGSITSKHRRIVAQLDGDQSEELLQKLCGIQYSARVSVCERSIESIEESVQKTLNNCTGTVCLKVTRSDKQFPMTSVDVSKRLGSLVNKQGLCVQFKGADHTIHVEISFDEVYVYSNKIPGVGGLPIDSSGRVLVLLSGGIDSPVAAYRMMRRGCHVDYVHIHPFPDNDKVKESKMIRLLHMLHKFDARSTLFVVPYHVYQFRTTGKIPDKYDPVVFKHYCFHLDQHIARTKKYDAIVTGDSLGQVASQTVENMTATTQGVTHLLFRPLVGYDKIEIINEAKHIGTYNISIEPYKDCCSIVAKNPSTRTKADKFKDVLTNVDIKQLCTSSMGELGTICL